MALISVRGTCCMKEETMDSHFLPVPLEALPGNLQLQTKKDDDVMMVDP